MLVHHLRILDRHRSNYNKQDTVLAQLVYNLNTARNNASVSRIGTTLVHHLHGPASHPRLCGRPPFPLLCNLYFDPSPNNHWPPLSCNRTTVLVQRRANAGPTLLVRIMNKTLAQYWVIAYNSFHLYINMPFFRLTSRINLSCQTDAVLITANKLKRDDSRAWF